MITKTMKVKQSSFRKLDDPFENGKSKKYIFYVKVDDVAEGIPMATNPREQKLTSAVAAAIQDSLLSNDGYFHLKNRGIVLSAESVHYNNAKEEVSIVFSDSLSHGDIDGGHTYKIVCLHKGEGLEQYVPFEVMTGVEDIIEQLAEARNTSVQVDQKSLAELAQRFEPIKEALEGMPFYQRIAFKQNQVSKDEETGKKLKMIDAREIVAIINMFDVESYSKSVHPTQAYSSKGKMLEKTLSDTGNSETSFPEFSICTTPLNASLQLRIMMQPAAGTGERSIPVTRTTRSSAKANSEGVTSATRFLTDWPIRRLPHSVPLLTTMPPPANIAGSTARILSPSGTPVRAN